ncbi:unnamed protein product [Amoebophrya sp. A120]|nr:unnamed protein product [Amoebophrya sp. A120]|eukprot:GSA120T00002252001.1
MHLHQSYPGDVYELCKCVRQIPGAYVLALLALLELKLTVVSSTRNRSKIFRSRLQYVNNTTTPLGQARYIGC